MPDEPAPHPVSEQSTLDQAASGLDTRTPRS